MRRILAAVALSFAGCHAQAKRPETAYERIEARMPALLAMIDRLGGEIAALPDCRAVAAHLRKFGLDHAHELPELDALRARLSPPEQERFAWEHVEDERHLTAVFRSIASICADSTEVSAARSIAGFR
jgi:hypothetical protein